jgi:hypothetical protein
MGNLYKIWNGPMPTTAAIAEVTTGTAIKTMLQLLGAVPFKVKEWGWMGDGFALAAPGVVELLTTSTVGATVTASAASDIMKYGDPNAPANTAGTSGTPFNLGTTHTGYTATAEGTITATRILDAWQASPMGVYVKQFPLGQEPLIAVGDFLRIRNTFATAINALCYVLAEV